MTERHIVAVIDDDPSALQSVVGLVRSLGHLAEGYPSGAAFLAAADALAAFLVLADVRMTGMGGFDLLARLLDADPLQRVVMITAYPSAEEHAWALSCGALDYLPKPITAVQLTRFLGA